MLAASNGAGGWLWHCGGPVRACKHRATLTCSAVSSTAAWRNRTRWPHSSRSLATSLHTCRRSHGLRAARDVPGRSYETSKKSATRRWTGWGGCLGHSVLGGKENCLRSGPERSQHSQFNAQYDRTERLRRKTRCTSGNPIGTHLENRVTPVRHQHRACLAHAHTTHQCLRTAILMGARQGI